MFYNVTSYTGTFYITGNICVVPIVKTVGLGLGMCIWGMINLLSGWSTGRYDQIYSYSKSVRKDHVDVNEYESTRKKFKFIFIFHLYIAFIRLEFNISLVSD